MKDSMTEGVIRFAAIFAASFILSALVFYVLGSKTQFVFSIVASTFLGVLTPITIIAIRHQVRLTRIKLINLFGRTFSLSTEAPGVAHGDNAVVAFEFVKGKYYFDLDIDEAQDPDMNKIPRFPMMTHSDWMLFFCSLPFMLFSSIGVFLLFVPFIDLVNVTDGGLSQWLWPLTLTVGGASKSIIQGSSADLYEYYHANTIVVAALAFAGAYFYCIRLLLRAVAVFDLSPVTFLRCFAHMLMAVLLAVVLYRVFPSIEGATAFLKELTGATPSAEDALDPRLGVKSIWLVLAFALGFIPDAALQYVLKKAGLTFKERYTELERYTKTVPVTVVDGVDHFIAFRLEESNIFDVQNLATFNPIMLHIESPYGIYQTVDWVAQAQLCTVVGPERFVALKQVNIRTIFDLERAILSEQADDSLVRAIGAILMMDCKREREARLEIGASEVVWKAAAGAEPERRANYRADLSIHGVKHLVALMVDDLHVRRLRQVWQIISRKLGPESACFEDTQYPPARAPAPGALAGRGDPGQTANSNEAVTPLLSAAASP